MDVRHWTITVFAATVSLAAPHLSRGGPGLGDRSPDPGRAGCGQRGQEGRGPGGQSAGQQRRGGGRRAGRGRRELHRGAVAVEFQRRRKRVELARYSGSAFVVTGATGRQIVVCDPGVLPWQVTFNVRTVQRGGRTEPRPERTAHAGRGGGTTAPSGRGGTGATGAPSIGSRGGAPPTNGGGTSARGGRGTSARGGGSSAGRGGAADTSSSRGGGAAPAKERTGTIGKPAGLPVSVQSGDRHPPDSGCPHGNSPGQGSLRVGNISETVLAGAAKIRFAQATLPGQAGPQIVDLASHSRRGSAVGQRRRPVAPTAGRGTLAGPVPAGRAALPPTVATPRIRRRIRRLQPAQSVRRSPQVIS